MSSETETKNSDTINYQHIEQQMPELLAMIDSLKADYYTTATAAQKEQIKQTLDFLITHRKEHPEILNSFIKIYNHMRKPTHLQSTRNKLIEKNFDLPQHLHNLAQKYGKMPTTDLDQCFNNQEIEVGLNTIPLYNANKELNHSHEYDHYTELAHSAFQKMITAEGDANQMLAELTQGKISFRIIDSEGFDGRFCAEKLKENELMIELTKGCFNPEHLNDMPMLLAHECGHLIDACTRPQNYLGNCKNGEEFVADSCGAQIAINAGFDTSGYTQFLRKQKMSERADVLEKIAQSHQPTTANNLVRSLSHSSHTNNY